MSARPWAMCSPWRCVRARASSLRPPKRWSSPQVSRQTSLPLLAKRFWRTLAPLSGAELARQAGVSSGVVKGLLEAGALAHVERSLDPPFAIPDPELPSRDLTGEQLEASHYLRDMVRNGGYRAALLDGITGSGKTEVYFEAIAEALRSDPEAQVLVLLPEIALTQAVTSRFEERFGATPAEWHSAAGSAARRRVWREVAAGRARIVVGARSALFLPFRKLKLIVIDEEHDPSYKQEDGVIYHARDLGVLRASMEPCSIVLASATPSLETIANAQQGKYAHIKLSARPGLARLRPSRSPTCALRRPSRASGSGRISARPSKKRSPPKSRRCSFSTAGAMRRSSSAAPVANG